MVYVVKEIDAGKAKPHKGTVVYITVQNQIMFLYVKTSLTVEKFTCSFATFENTVYNTKKVIRLKGLHCQSRGI